MKSAPFYIGQKVIYITGLEMPKYSVHTVTDITQDPCGCWIILIRCNELGSKFNSATQGRWKCVMCGKPKQSFYAGWAASSFRTLQQTRFPLMTFSKIVEREKEERLIDN